MGQAQINIGFARYNRTEARRLYLAENDPRKRAELKRKYRNARRLYEDACIRGSKISGE